MSDQQKTSPLVQLLVRSMDRPTLPDLLEALVAQTYPAIEVLVINASGAPHRPLPALDRPARLIEPGIPLSRPAAANRALDEAGAAMAMFVDDDDLIEPTHVARLVQALIDTPQAPAAYAGVRLEAEGGELVKTLDEPWSGGRLTIRNFLPIHAVLFRMAAVRHQACRFDEDLKRLEDWDFWLQLAQGGDFVHVPGVSARYRLHYGQSQLSAERDAAAFIEARRRVYRKWLPHTDPTALAESLGTLSDALEQREWDIDAVRAEARRTQADLEEKLAALRHDRDALINSRSMRVTAPLRALSHRMGQFRRSMHHHRARALAGRSLPVARADQTGPDGPVDIIVPVYKGLEETRACLESIWAAAPRRAYRLVVINDMSPEPALTQWLREAADRHPMMLLENEENLGFVGTVNRGMQLSERADVVLLNSDAEVGNDWLDRLAAAAYSSTERPVASVTPFSNNATICSYPRFCEDNPIPPDYDYRQLDRLFAACNAGQTVEIPTAIGFCMYIRRESLDAVGTFDEASFGKGYGEENDFCMRALKAGWCHLHALDTFVWHKGSVSFGASQNDRMQAAGRILNDLHPDYPWRVDRFIQADPARAARTRVDLERLRRSPRPCVLLVSHSLGGGVAQHCNDLARLTAHEVDYLMLKPASNGQSELSWLDDAEALALHYPLPEAEPALVGLLQALGVSRVHYHHLLGHADAVRQLARRLGVPYDVTIHDYRTVCPQINLTSTDGRYCGEKGLAQCHECLRHRPAPDGSDITSWRARHEEWLTAASRCLAPSRDTAARIQRYFPDLEVAVAPHPGAAGEPPAERLTPPAADEPLRVAVVGALSPEKGADQLEAMAAHIKRHDLPIRLRLFGYGYRHLARSGTLEVTGPYEAGHLSSLLAAWQPHVAWFPAQWPETWCYALSTCLDAELPVVASDLGALPERLRRRPLSSVLAHDSTIATWADALLAFRELPEQRLTPAGTPLPRFYPEQYLAPIECAEASQAPLDEGWTDHLITRAPADRSHRIRQHLVGALYAGRQVRWLQPIVRRIPAGTQRRVKRLLLGQSG